MTTNDTFTINEYNYRDIIDLLYSDKWNNDQEQNMYVLSLEDFIPKFDNE
ncbi:hypothetical protein [Mycoplasmopsis edwardii]|uniref:Uncharacterized protein n=1 Tax=Mycoplasmopsis edwardii TaxID=53558 RepID=A0ACD4PGI2_9BACT|nr:hypothetical protein [Mycoplasmopsis edwardii]WBP83746.1 hypothetical protein Me_995_000365 [Mycoplasmopsis edwardii]